MNKRDPAHRNITRTGNSWWVRVYRTLPSGETRCFQRSFADSKHGGRRAALVEATRWRDQTVSRLPSMARRNLTRVPPGHGYIRRRTVWRERRKGGYYQVEIYEAWLRLDDFRNASTKWTIDKHGKDAALAACQKWMRAQRRALAKRLRASGLPPMAPLVD